jgi:hypothetical protein
MAQATVQFARKQHHQATILANANYAPSGETPRKPGRSACSQTTGYARAIAWSRGYAAEETKAAVARAQELA